MGAFVPWAVAAACQNSQYEVIWRTSMGIGVLFPLVLFVLRLYIKEPEEFQRNSMRHAKTPYWLSLRFYGWRLFCVSLIWFIYDVSISTTASPEHWPHCISGPQCCQKADT